MEIVIQNDFSEIARVNRAVDGWAGEHAIPAELLPNLKTVLDEVLGNVVSYGWRDDFIHDIRIRAECSENRLVVTVADDGTPFNPLDFPAPDLETGLDGRKIGGLGIHIVRKLTEDLSYRRAGDENILTLAWDLGEAVRGDNE